MRIPYIGPKVIIFISDSKIDKLVSSEKFHDYSEVSDDYRRRGSYSYYKYEQKLFDLGMLKIRYVD